MVKFVSVVLLCGDAVYFLSTCYYGMKITLVKSQWKHTYSERKCIKV